MNQTSHKIPTTISLSAEQRSSLEAWRDQMNGVFPGSGLATISSTIAVMMAALSAAGWRPGFAVKLTELMAGASLPTPPAPPAAGKDGAPAYDGGKPRPHNGRRAAARA